MLVIGGGIIGLEMACVYDALGAKVSVVEFADGLIPAADRDIVNASTTARWDVCLELAVHTPRHQRIVLEQTEHKRCAHCTLLHEQWDR